MKKNSRLLKYRYWFDSRNTGKDLKLKSISGGISTTANQFITFGLNLVSTFILARILLPSDFGLVGMVTAFTGFAHIIKDLGLSTAVIQKEEVSHRQVSNLFWINIAICFVLACLFVAISPLIVTIYQGDSRIYPIILSYAIGIIISGFGLQHMALMCRKMLFSHIAKANIIATLIGVSFGIAAALSGMGYWSIVILNLSVDFLNTCLVWIFCNWRPSIYKQKESIKDFIRFGVGLSGSNTINYFSKNVDNILIGSVIGPSAVGFYSKAYQLLMLPINQLRTPLTLVATPALSALRKDPWRYINYYKKYIFILAFVSMPLVGYLTIFSEELIRFVLGDQWLASNHIFNILAIAGFIMPVANSRGLILISTGQTKRLLYLVLTLSSTTILGFAIGINWGTTGVALSLPITTYLLLIPSLAYSFKNTPIKLSHFFGEIWLPAIHSLAMILFLLLLKQIFSQYLTHLLIFFILSPVGIIFYYLSWKIYPSGRAKFSNIDELQNILFEKLIKKIPSRIKTLFYK